jgi:hypothetical protein
VSVAAREEIVVSKLNEQSRLWISFAISEFSFNPTEITKTLKQKPNHTQIAGQKIPGMRVNAPFNQWSVKFESKAPDLEVLMDIFINTFKGPNLSKVTKGTRSGVTAVLEVVGSDTRPSVTLRADQMKWLADRELDFCVDYYFFSKAKKRAAKKVGARS